MLSLAACLISVSDSGLPAPFAAAFEQVAREGLDAATLTRTVRTDGPLALEWFNAETVALLDAQLVHAIEILTFIAHDLFQSPLCPACSRGTHCSPVRCSAPGSLSYMVNP